MGDSIRYLLEFRKRLIRCLLVIGVVFILFAMVANQIYHLFSLPIVKHLSGAKALIATAVPAPFIVPFESAFVAAIYVTVPYWLYQLWAFVAPALYRREKRLVWPLLVSSSLLFYMGTLFAYFVVLPLMFHFFIHVAPRGVEVKPDISQYFSFVLRLFFAFGLSFELPVAMMLMVWSGVTSVKKLAKKRVYIIIGAFVVGMLLTPPDVLSQVLLAIPIWILYEVGLLMARFFVRSPEKMKIDHE